MRQGINFEMMMESKMTKPLNWQLKEVSIIGYKIKQEIGELIDGANLSFNLLKTECHHDNQEKLCEKPSS